MIHPVDFRLGVSKFWNSKVCNFNFSNYFKNYVFYYKINVFFNYLFYNSYILYIFNSGSVKKITGLVFKRKRSKAIRKNWGLGIHELTFRKRRFQRSVFAYKGIILFTYFYVFLFKGSLFIKLFFINSYLLVFSKKIYKYLSRVKRMKKYFDYDTVFIKRFLKKKKDALLISEKRNFLKQYKFDDSGFYFFSDFNSLKRIRSKFFYRSIYNRAYRRRMSRRTNEINTKDYRFLSFIKSFNKSELNWKEKSIIGIGSNKSRVVKLPRLGVKKSFVNLNLTNRDSFNLLYYLQNIKLNFNFLLGIGKQLLSNNFLLKLLKSFVYHYLYNSLKKIKLKNFLVFFKMVKNFLLEIFNKINIKNFSKLLIKNKLKNFFFKFKRNLILKKKKKKINKLSYIKKYKVGFKKFQKKKNISLKHLSNLSTFFVNYKRLFLLKYDPFNYLLERKKNEEEVMYNFFFKRNFRKHYYSLAQIFFKKYNNVRSVGQMKIIHFQKYYEILYLKIDKIRKKKMKKYLNYQFELDLNIGHVFNKLYSFIFIFFFFLSFIYRFLILYKKFYFLKKNLKFKFKRFFSTKLIGRKKNAFYFFSGSINFVNVRICNIRLFLK